MRRWYLQCLGERGVGIEWFQLAQDRKRWRTVVSGEYEPPAGNPEAKVQPRKGRTKGGVIRATLKDRKRTVGTEMTVVCVICTKQCKGPKGLAQHMHRAHRTGMNKKILQMPAMSPRIPLEASLADHLRLHKADVQKVFKCRNAGLFSSSPGRTPEARGPQSSFKFQCKLCSFGSDTIGGLQTHHRVKHGETQKVCDLCGKRFPRPSKMLQHRGNTACQRAARDGKPPQQQVCPVIPPPPPPPPARPRIPQCESA